jgi:hypothetical protein
MAKYRILKSNEIIRSRDQAYDPYTRGWFYVGNNACLLGNKVVYARVLYRSTRFRRPVKD